MSYEVRCECGKMLAVSAADAGSSVSCACGRKVDVRPLHQLRTSGGEAAIPLIAQVRAMLRNGLLPGTRTCVVCGAEANRSSRVKVLCERVPNRAGPSKAEVVGCLLGPFFIGWLLALLVVLGLRTRRKSVGDEEAVVVPLPVCEACRPKVTDPKALAQALRGIPDYAALLDRYPDAEVTLLS